MKRGTRNVERGSLGASASRREFLKQGALFVPMIFVPRLIRAQPILTADGLAAFGTNAPAGGGGGGGDTNPVLVTGQTLSGTLRHDVNGEVGFQFTVGASPMTVTSLGRWVVSGNSKTHLLILRSAACGGIIASCTVNCNGATAGQYLFGTISPTVLSAATSYRVMSTETTAAPNEEWYDFSSITTTGDVNTVSGAYFISGTCGSSSSGGSYVVPNLKYHL